MPAENDPITSSVPDSQVLIAAYSELCKTHQGLDDFKMRLLGLLPIASVVGLFTLNLGRAGSNNLAQPNEVVAYVGFFAAAFTLSLFVFELRGILMCNDLMASGRELEDKLGVKGQFCVCTEKRRTDHYKWWWQRFLSRHLNGKLASSSVYSLVFSVWFFVGLRYGAGLRSRTCAIWATSVGFVLALASYLVIINLIEFKLNKQPAQNLVGEPAV